MLDSLKGTFTRLIHEQQSKTYRYLYPALSNKDRLVGIIGARGVGKTTLLLQYIKNHFPSLEGVFYFSADHIYFNSNTLYGFVEERVLTEGIHHFFIDEIHKYPNWDQELKNLYDGFPKLKIVFSGSSSLDLVKGTYDLSRRVKLYTLHGLSFREYLNFKTNSNYDAIDFKTFLEDPASFNEVISSIPLLKGHFKEYLQYGYYPFFLEGLDAYYDRILRIVEKTIYEDISKFYKLKTQNLAIFQKILNYLSAIEPGNFNTHNLAKNLSIDDKTGAHYLNILRETGLVRMVFPNAKGNQVLRKIEKIFLNNTTLSYAVNSALGENLSIGLVRELFFLQSIQNAHKNILYSEVGDYKTKDYLFEIGGKNKTRHQTRNATLPAWLVKEDILYATKHEIPLYFFGFLY
jgi:uncharacterized protein